jgi:hypothetical protein
LRGVPAISARILQFVLMLLNRSSLIAQRRAFWRILEEMAGTPLNEGEAFSVEFSGGRAWDTQILQPMAR